MKTTRAILIGIGIWAAGVSAFTLSYYVPILENPDQQANIVLFTVVMPLVWLGSHLYYKNDRSTHGYLIGQTFLLVAAALDALVTVPVFMIPNGVNHYDFFTDPGFWGIACEFIAVAVLYYYIKVYPKTQTVKN